jgi:RNase H-fold protein (predicted Holliday junction resolvase)
LKLYIALRIHLIELQAINLTVIYLTMASNAPVVLAIAPGTREWGIAIFEGFNLIYYGVKTFHHLKSSEDEKTSISKLLDDLSKRHSLQSIIVKQVNQYQQTSLGLTSIVKQIKNLAETKHIRVEEISLVQVKSLLCKNRKTTQKKAFETVANLYPELRQFQNRPNKWQTDYYAYIFSATAVALVYLNNLSCKDN